VPFLVLIVLDITIAMTLVWYVIRKRFQNRREAHGLSKSKGISAISATMTGYKELPEEALDYEMMPVNATYVPGSDAWTGFEAALDMPIPVSSDTEAYDQGLTPQLRAFVDSMRKATDASQFGLSFTYTDLSFHPKGVHRPILQNVTGSIERGSLTAVMGGSGAGKSTFVNVLMGKTTNTGGTVMVNNIPGRIKRYKKLIGYVPQDDGTTSSHAYK
jgi:ABC-type multidrug transport system fused ATPase/permease subunit